MANRADLLIIIGLVFSGFALLFFVIGFSTPHWLELDTNHITENGFEKLGLWEACFNNYVHFRDFTSKTLNGCWWIFSEEYRPIWEYINPPWFLGIQIMMIITLLLELMTVLQCLLFLIKCCKRNVIGLFIVGGFAVVSGILTAISVILFGAKSATDNHWIQMPEKNFVSWSFGCVTFSGFLILLAGITIFVAALHTRLLDSYNKSEPYEYQNSQKEHYNSENENHNSRNTHNSRSEHYEQQNLRNEHHNSENNENHYPEKEPRSSRNTHNSRSEHYEHQNLRNERHNSENGEFDYPEKEPRNSRNTHNSRSEHYEHQNSRNEHHKSENDELHYPEREHRNSHVTRNTRKSRSEHYEHQNSRNEYNNSENDHRNSRRSRSENNEQQNSRNERHNSENEHHYSENERHNKRNAHHNSRNTNHNSRNTRHNSRNSRTRPPDYEMKYY